MNLEWYWYLVIIIPIIITLVLLKAYINGGVNIHKPNMKDKIVIITGSNAGIGKSTAEELYKLGATIILACRSKDKTD